MFRENQVDFATGQLSYEKDQNASDYRVVYF